MFWKDKWLAGQEEMCVSVWAGEKCVCASASTVSSVCVERWVLSVVCSSGVCRLGEQGGGLGQTQGQELRAEHMECVQGGRN